MWHTFFRFYYVIRALNSDAFKNGHLEALKLGYKRYCKTSGNALKFQRDTFTISIYSSVFHFE
jgi:hypothetical protein